MEKQTAKTFEGEVKNMLVLYYYYLQFLFIWPPISNSLEQPTRVKNTIKHITVIKTYMQ